MGLTPLFFGVVGCLIQAVLSREIYPGCFVCKCNYTVGLVDCRSRNLRSLPPNASLPSSGIYSYDFSSNKIDHVDPYYFHSFKDIAHIVGDFNRLEKPFVLPTTVRTLNLVGNHISDINGFFSEGEQYPVFSRLILRYNRIDLSTGFVRDFPALCQIDLSGNDISQIQSAAFRNLSSLRRLSLSDNSLSLVTSDMFADLGKCEEGGANLEIILDNNCIAELPPKALNLICLVELGLNSNKMSNISRDAFQLLPYMRTLRIASNRLESLEEETFYYQRTILETLDLSNNSFRSINGRPFRNKNELYVFQLSLQGNGLEEIDASFFSTLQIIYLDVSGNRLSKFPPTLSNQKYLRRILCVSNYFQTITTSTFVDLPNLYALNLMENQITTLEENVFLTLPSIQAIYLHQNPISNMSLKSLSFSNKTQNVHVYFQCSEIDQIPPFSSNVHVHCASRGSLANFTAHVSSVNYLRYNGFICSKIVAASNCVYFTCHQCPTGTRSIAVPSSRKYDSICVPCPAGGFYQDDSGKSLCKNCVNGSFVAPHSSPGKTASACQVCPRGTKTSDHAGYRACKCLTNYYRLERFGPCFKCRYAGQQCMNDYVRVKKGYWWNWASNGVNTTDELEQAYRDFVNNLSVLDDSYSRESMNFSGYLPQIYRCPIKDACNGRSDADANVRIGNAKMCSEGYQGALCAHCSKGYYTWFERCYECPPKWRTGLQLIGLVCTLLLLVAVLYVVDKVRGSDSGRHGLIDRLSSTLKIIVGFVQVMSGVFDALTYIPWPQVLLTFSHYMKLAELNVLAVASPTCISEQLRVNALVEPIFKVACQVGLLASIWIYYGIKRQFFLTSDVDVSRTRTSCFRNAWWILFICYPSTSDSIMATFPYKSWTCLNICLSKDKANPLCRSLLKEDLSVECRFDDPRWRTMWIMCWSLISYVVLLPLLLLAALWIKRKKTLKTDFLRSIEFLDDNYKARYWYWEVVEIGRKFLLTFGISYFGRMSHSGLALATLLAILFLVLHAQFRPIKRNSGHWLQLLSLAVISTNLIMGTLFLVSYEDKEDTGYNGLLDEKAFSCIVLAVNIFFLVYLAGKFFYILAKTVKEVTRKYGRVKILTCLMHLVGREEEEESLENDEASIPLLGDS